MAITKLTADSITSGAIANTPAFEARLSADQTISDDTLTKITLDTEIFDTNSDYDNSTNYRFTPTLLENILYMVLLEFSAGDTVNIHNIYL
jgi:hypothetical protein